MHIGYTSYYLKIYNKILFNIYFPLLFSFTFVRIRSQERYLLFPH